MAIPHQDSAASSRKRDSKQAGFTKANPITIDDDEDAPTKSLSRSTKSRRKREAVDLTDDQSASPSKKPRLQSEPSIKKKPTKDKDDVGEDTAEKRLRRHRAKPPATYTEIAARAMTQRFCVLERHRTHENNIPEETIEMAGSTGNIYTIKICELPSCDCPHARKGHQCKHIVYALKRTLRAPDHLAYQLALLPSELRQIFANAPPIPTTKGQADAADATEENEDPNRKPLEDDCPICCVEFDPRRDKIVWCKGACGNNVHKGCFETWAKMKRSQGVNVTCPFCRTPWQDDGLSDIAAKDAAVVGPEGYRNIAASLGLSGLRGPAGSDELTIVLQRHVLSLKHSTREVDGQILPPPSPPKTQEIEGGNHSNTVTNQQRELRTSSISLSPSIERQSNQVRWKREKYADAALA